MFIVGCWRGRLLLRVPEHQPAASRRSSARLRSTPQRWRRVSPAPRWHGSTVAILLAAQAPATARIELGLPDFRDVALACRLAAFRQRQALRDTPPATVRDERVPAHSGPCDFFGLNAEPLSPTPRNYSTAHPSFKNCNLRHDRVSRYDVSV